VGSFIDPVDQEDCMGPGLVRWRGSQGLAHAHFNISDQDHSFFCRTRFGRPHAESWWPWSEFRGRANSALVPISMITGAAWPGPVVPILTSAGAASVPVRWSLSSRPWRLDPTNPGPWKGATVDHASLPGQPPGLSGKDRAGSQIPLYSCPMEGPTA